MKKGLLSIFSVIMFITVLIGNVKTTEVSAAEKKGTTADGFVYEVQESDGTIEITGYQGKKKKLVFPEKINGKKVTKIGYEAIISNKYVVSVEVPDSVKIVDGSAFNYCKNLVTLKLGKNVSQISGIEECDMNIGKKFKEFKVSSGNKVYESIDGVLFKKGVNGGRMLLKCPPAKKGKKYRIPEETISVELMAFSDSQLNSITFPVSVTNIYGLERGLGSNIAEYKVDGASEKYYAKDGVLFEKDSKEMMYGKSGGDRLLAYPSGKRDASYQVPQGVTVIGAYAFAQHKYLQEVELPDSMVCIAEGAFLYCKKLKKAVICGIPDDGAFASCEKLMEVELKNVEGIGQGAFRGSGLKNVVIPESVGWIQPHAFVECGSLQWVEIRNKNCVIDGYSYKEAVVMGTFNKTVIYGYPDSTAEKYADEMGQEFRTIGESRPEAGRPGTITRENIKLSQVSYVYDGKPKKPEVLVIDKFGKEISEPDYKLVYKNNINTGVAVVKVKFSGQYYAGTIQTTFVITPPKSRITKLTPGKNDITLQWSGVKASQISGYEIQYSTSSKFEADSTQNVRVNKRDAVKKQIKNLESKKTYYVRIRSYKTVKRDGKTERLYSKWSDKKKVKTV